MKDKLKRLFVRIYPFLFMIAILLAIGFIVVSQIIRERNGVYIPFFIAGIVCIVSVPFLIWLFVKAEKWEWVKKLERKMKRERIKKLEETGKIRRYKINLDTSNTSNFISGLKTQLANYKTVNFEGGTLLYSVDESKISKIAKLKYIKAFYIPPIEFTLTYKKKEEKQRLVDFDKRLNDYFITIGLSTTFIYCVTLITEESISETKKDFYYTFKGFWDADDNHGDRRTYRLTLDKHYTYCGINKENNKVYFYYPTSSDGGTEVCLDGLICRELDLTKLKAKPKIL